MATRTLYRINFSPADCCGSSRTDTEAACPLCGQTGLPVEPITPRHLLTKEKRGELVDGAVYFFCETADCAGAYFSEDGAQVFEVSDLRTRITAKDSSPETRLCYCFKISKGDVLKEIEDTGTTGVISQIKAKMKERGCFCEKANPRGRCCMDAIQTWIDTR